MTLVTGIVMIDGAMTIAHERQCRDNPPNLHPSAIFVPVLQNLLSPVWRPALASGSPQLDTEHQQLFSMLEQIGTKLAARDTESIPAQLVALLEQTRIHCANEEGILERVGYSGIVGHRRMHAELLTKMEQLLERNLPLGVPGMETLAVRFYDGIVLHVVQEDRAYYPCLRNPA